MKYFYDNQLHEEMPNKGGVAFCELGDVPEDFDDYTPTLNGWFSQKKEDLRIENIEKYGMENVVPFARMMANQEHMMSQLSPGERLELPTPAIPVKKRYKDVLKPRVVYSIEHGITDITKEDVENGRYMIQVTGYDKRRKCGITQMGNSDSYGRFCVLHRWKSKARVNYYYAHWDETTLKFKWYNRWASTLENAKISIIKMY